MNNMNVISKANEAWKTGQRAEAIHILETENELKQDDELIRVLIHFYVENKQFKAAIELIRDQPAKFIEQKNTFRDYFEALVQTKIFSLARKELFNYYEETTPDLKKYLNFLENQENEYAIAFPKTMKENERDFYHLGDKRVIQQAAVIEKAYYLPWSNFKRAAKFNLVDPFLNQITRVSILKDLVLMRLEEPVRFIWIDEKEYEVFPKDLLGTDEMWKKIKKAIENYNDPVQSEMLQQQAELLYELSYPFSKRVLPTSEEWLTALKKQFFEGKDIKAFKELNQIMINLFEE